ncbi:DNA polymerase-3 subunit gamma/tau [Hydrogenoanaerobacterium saccharovorans]|uniref:DNA-directed DNA polymerase n=1 Tax=Hydrogenoanaerobacterium saccharovorans TaxID=474960 RepID=A0A1H8AJK4_9FIRM|nr:DNA polymerase III subunit gamma/tau [Hydrogenoanaerobacterium saccharovorans]RPF47910.1 DNA polymerase-3 subunit gamma/tau [Hydrogenoanaerobacterium saccharovorans]SEM70791.1 DNA polymerase-3 subunit gamma/tau [Hydrogenoanaerobacterium saccharovorans]
MYQALYRKYRPTVFDDVVGQEHITTTLKNEVATGKTSHAYLFTGSRGTGKTTCSKILAKAVNCPNAKSNGNPCGECDICRGVDDGSIMDVVEIDAASNNGVDNIRQLREEAYFLPTMCKKRVYIIDETHMLSTGAFNALLKIMEEPPEHVLFILATTEVHKIPATILSRCQRFDFRRIASDTIAGRLEAVSAQEGLTLSHDAALLIARLADGGMRDALSLLDLCASHSKEIDTQVVAGAAGLAGHEHLFDLTSAIANNNTGSALAIIDDLYTQSIDLGRLCEELISHFRNLMILKSATKPEELIVALPEEIAHLKEQQAQIKMPAILNGLTVLQETLGRMSRSQNRRTELEMAVIRLCNPQLDTTAESLLVRLEQLETAVKTGAICIKAGQSGSQDAKSAAETGNPTKPTESKEKHDIVSAPNVTDTEDDFNSSEPNDEKQLIESLTVGAVPMQEWSEVLARLAKTNPALTGTLRGSSAYIQGDICLIDCSDQLFFTLIRQSEVSKTTLRDALFEQTGKRFRLGPYKKANEPAAQQQTDPIDELAKMVQDAGLPVEIK